MFFHLPPFFLALIISVILIPLFLFMARGNPKRRIFDSAVLFVLCFIVFNIMFFFIISGANYKNFITYENVAKNISCPDTNDNVFVTPCSTALRNTSFLEYYMFGYKNPNDVLIGYAGNVVKSKQTGDFYLEVFSYKLNGKKHDLKKESRNDLKSEFIKFSDVPKVFDKNVDINSIANSDIDIHNPKYVNVDKFTESDLKGK